MSVKYEFLTDDEIIKQYKIITRCLNTNLIIKYLFVQFFKIGTRRIF